jgi:MFS family permease
MPGARKQMKKNNVRRTLLMAALGSVALMPLLVLPVMVGSFVDHLGLSDSEAGYVASAGFLGGAMAAFYISLRIHHLSLRRLAFIGLGILILTDGISIAAAQLPAGVFVALRFISGAGGVAAYASVMSAYAGWREPDRAYGLFMAIQFLVSSVGLFGLPWILPDTGVSGLFALFTMLDVAALLLVVQLPGSDERKPAGSGSPVEWRVILAQTSLLCLLGIGLFEASNMASFTYAERIGVSFGLQGSEIGLVLGTATLLGIPAAFGVFLLGSRFGRYPPILVTALIQSSALLILLTGPGELKYVISMCLMAMGWGFALPYFQAIEAQIDPRGSVVVAGGFATSFGGFLGPALAASLISPGSYGGMIVTASASYIVVIILMRMVSLRMRC